MLLFYRTLSMYLGVRFLDLDCVLNSEIGTMLPLRSMRPTQPEYGSADLYLHGSPDSGSKARDTTHSSGNLPRVVLWTRLPGKKHNKPGSSLNRR